MKRLIIILSILVFTSTFYLFAQEAIYSGYFCNEDLLLNDQNIEFSWNSENLEWEITKEYNFKYSNLDELQEIVCTDVNSKEYLNRTIYGYNSQGLNIERIFQLWVSGEWSNITRTTYIFNDLDEREVITIQNFEENNWQNFQRHLYYYNDQNLLDYYYRQFWENGQWVSKTVHNYSYDENSNIIERIETRLSDDLLTVKYSFKYDEYNLRTEYLRQVWQNNHWINTHFVKYFYRFNALMTESILQTWSNNQWDNETRILYKYIGLTDKKVTICHKGNSISISINALEAHLKHGDCIGKCIDGKNKSAQENLFPFNERDLKSKLIIYPNPISDYAIIEFKDLKIYKIDILNLSGETVITKNIDEGQNEVRIERGNLKKGTYVVRSYGDVIVSKKLIIE